MMSFMIPRTVLGQYAHIGTGSRYGGGFRITVNFENITELFFTRQNRCQRTWFSKSSSLMIYRTIFWPKWPIWDRFQVPRWMLEHGQFRKKKSRIIFDHAICVSKYMIFQIKLTHDPQNHFLDPIGHVGTGSRYFGKFRSNFVKPKNYVWSNNTGIVVHDFFCQLATLGQVSDTAMDPGIRSISKILQLFLLQLFLTRQYRSQSTWFSK